MTAGPLPYLTPAPPGSPFGAALRRLREARGFTQMGLAQALDCDRSYVNRMESGERIPSRAMLQSLFDALELEPSDRLSLLEHAGLTLAVAVEEDDLLVALRRELANEQRTGACRDELRRLVAQVLDLWRRAA